jgi:hypothetical protein
MNCSLSQPHIKIAALKVNNDKVNAFKGSSHPSISNGLSLAWQSDVCKILGKESKMRIMHRK